MASNSSPTPVSQPNERNQRSNLTVEAVKAMVPKHDHQNVQRAYTAIEGALENHIKRKKLQLDSDQKEILGLYIYATVTAETGNFAPRSEPVNRTNTTRIPLEYLSWGDVVKTDYNKYSLKSGNTSQSDAEKYHGRGYVQLTGKGNYSHYGAAAGVPDLLVNPDKASENETAAKLLVAYIMEDRNRSRILKALNEGDMVSARAVVNGGNHFHKPNGMRDFKRALVKGMEATDPNLKNRTSQAILNDPQA